MARALSVLTACVIAATCHPAAAVTDAGHFMRGGGIGSAKCLDFIAAMASVTREGGLNSIGGANIINPYMQYLIGFQTGYNMGKPGPYDVLAPLEEDAHNKALVWIDAWCTRNPELNFDLGIFALVKVLRPDMD